MMKQLEIDQFPCLEDNYGYLLHDPETGATATIDTPDIGAITQRLNDKGWTLTHIFNTHHHWDHAGGNLELKQETGCEIIGPAIESEKIPGIDRAVDQDDMVAFGNHYLEVLNVGGHTLGHIAYFLRAQKTAFVGDALFAMGCGRLFEGTPAQMWASLSRLNRLPADTIIYCAHEYTLANAAFALSIDPQNQTLINRVEEVKSLRAAGQPSVPTILSLERETNPCLRVDDVSIRALLDMPKASQVDVFAEIRHRKDNFKG